MQIVFICGYGRSGSTLLNRVLGSHEEAIAIGEFYQMWRYFLCKNHVCSCGKHLTRCPLWKAAITSVAKNSNHNFVKETKKILYKHTPKYKGIINTDEKNNLTTRKYAREKREIKIRLKKVYKSISEISNKSIIVDASKYVPYAKLLTEIGDIEVKYIHIVRDLINVHSSRSERKKIANTGKHTDRYSFVRTYLGWHVYNIMAKKLCSKSMSCNIKYENMCREPARTIQNIVEKLQLGWDVNQIFTGPRAVYLPKGHIPAGNAMRFENREIKIEDRNKKDNSTSEILKRLVKTVTFYDQATSTDHKSV